MKKKKKNCMLIKSSWINYILHKVSVVHYDFISLGKTTKPSNLSGCWSILLIKTTVEHALQNWNSFLKLLDGILINPFPSNWRLNRRLKQQRGTWTLIILLLCILCEGWEIIWISSLSLNDNTCIIMLLALLQSYFVQTENHCWIPHTSLH